MSASFDMWRCFEESLFDLLLTQAMPFPDVPRTKLWAIPLPDDPESGHPRVCIRGRIQILVA